MHYAVFVTTVGEYDEDYAEVVAVADLSRLTLERNIRRLEDKFGNFICFTEAVRHVDQEYILSEWLTDFRKKLTEDIIALEKRLMELPSEEEYARINEEAKQKRKDLEDSYRRQGVGATMGPLPERSRSSDEQALNEAIMVAKKDLEEFQNA